MKNKLPNSFIIPYLILLAVGAAGYFLFEKTSAHLFVNQFHNGLLDLFFYYLTYLGDGIFIIVATIIAAFFNVRLALLLFTSYALSAGITQVLKHFLFDEWMRPAAIFEANAQIKQLYIVKGVELNYHNSFPSGHSTSAFAFFFSLSIFSSKNIIQILLFCLAVLTAYSRVYLSQHFFIDIYAGSFIGTICSFVLYKYWIDGLNEKYNQPLINFIK
jgi:membrane-associated phospholipid phosphatase